MKVIPANPGFERLHVSFEGDETYVDREPVIAWLIEDYDRYPDPLCFEQEYILTPWAIKYPTGGVTIPHDESFDSETLWLNEMRRRYRCELEALKPPTESM